MTQTHNAPPLARACLDHLRLEIDAITRLHLALAAVRRSLLDGDPTLGDHRAVIAAYHETMARARVSFRERCSELTGIPNATLGHAVARLGEPWLGLARERRERLILLGEETRELSRRVVSILAFCDSFTRRLIAQLVGDGERYGPDGALLGSSRLPESVSGAA